MHVFPRAVHLRPFRATGGTYRRAPAAMRRVVARVASANTVSSDLEKLRESASTVFAVLLWFHVVVVALIAYTNHLSVLRVVPIMVAAAVAGTFAALYLGGLIARLLIAGALTVGPSMMVYAGQGPWQVDWHMYFFVVFGMLVVYVDWRPIVLAAGFTALDNLVLDLIFPGAVFPDAQLSRVLLHAAIVVVDCAVLFWLVSLMQQLFRQTAASLASARAAAAEAQRLESYAKHGSDLIMQAVNQGLLLCDGAFAIQPQYSSELEKIFETKDLAGRNLLELLQGLLTDRLFRTTSDYFAMLFDQSKKERTVLRVNPLSEVECSFWDGTAHTYASKYLSFNFRRIVENGRVIRVFVAVNDITERVKLERRLLEAERKKDRQVELLLGLLRIEPAALDAFVASAREQLRTIGETPLITEFATAGNGRSALLPHLDTILACVHRVNGAAALIRFGYFQRRATEFEARLCEVRGHVVFGGDDYLTIAFALSELRDDLDELEALRGRFPRSLALREEAVA